MKNKLMATALISATLLFGLGGVASAATPAPATPAHTFNCANAPKIEARITTVESKANAWLPKAQGRLTKAEQGGHPRVVARIQRRIAKVNKVLTRVQNIDTKVMAACPSSGPSTPS